MSKRASIYFEDAGAWRQWLLEYYDSCEGVHLIFYTVDHPKSSMRWEEAVRVALCFGWIDSTVRSLGEGKRQQYFCPRKPKSAWSKLNKKHIAELLEAGLMHESGLARIEQAKKDGSWNGLDDVENGVIPTDLKAAFKANPLALGNYEAFSRTYRKSYLYWLNQAKRPETRENRIREIIRLCAANIKSRS